MLVDEGDPGRPMRFGEAVALFRGARGRAGIEGSSRFHGLRH